MTHSPTALRVEGDPRVIPHGKHHGVLVAIGWELPAGLSTYVLVPFHAATYVSPSALDAHTNAMGTEECAGNLIP